MTIPLFQAFGVELEYMIVDRATLDIVPAADQLLAAVATLPGAEVVEGSPEFPSEVALGPMAWSNELCAHIIEIKTAAPAPTLTGLAAAFQSAVSRSDDLLAPMGLALLPSGTHPWMDPGRETHLWPHEHADFYRMFDRFFNCSTHGWANLQAAHLNLPFANDEEFARLHAAVRFLLPILPALAASSPILDSRPTGILDNRLEVYRTNSRTVASIAGRIIPEPARSRAEYESRILHPIYRDMAALDPDGLLRHEWLNSRGAIARFSRNTIEIRILDVQECPGADVAILTAISEVLRAICTGRLGHIASLADWPVEPLSAVFIDCIRHADLASIADPEYLSALGHTSTPSSAAALWHHLLSSIDFARHKPAEHAIIDRILTRGCLSRRLLARLPSTPTRADLHTAYTRLAACLRDGVPHP